MGPRGPCQSQLLHYYHGDGALFNLLCGLRVYNADERLAEYGNNVTFGVRDCFLAIKMLKTVGCVLSENMTEKLQKTLADIGLSSNEASVYLTLLSLGPTTALKLARGTGIKRSTVYLTLESLKQRGLVALEMHGFKSLFVAENPEKLDAVLEERKLRLGRDLPELLSLYNLKGGESTMKYYEGFAGLKQVYESMIRDIRPHEKYLVLSHLEPVVGLDHEFFEDFFRRRSKLNIDLRLLLQDTPEAHRRKKIERNFNERIKILPPKVSLVTNLVIVPRRVLIQQSRPPVFGIVIENKSIIEMHQQMFEIMWHSIPD